MDLPLSKASCATPTARVSPPVDTARSKSEQSAARWVSNTTGKALRHGPANVAEKLQGHHRQDLEPALRADPRLEGISHLPLEPGRRQEPAHRHLLGGSQDVWAHGARCSDQDQKRD